MDQLATGNIMASLIIIISDVIVYYTAYQLPLPTQTSRTTIVQLKQIPNVNDTFYHS